MNTPPLRLGISTRLMHAPPAELGFRGKTLLYLEQSLAHWIMSHRALAVMVPTLGFDAEVSRRRVSVDQYVDILDALVLQGGADVSPATYGQEPLHADWSGDPIRDRYEIELIDGFRKAGKPVLGICRGAQLINVAYGGTLIQDIRTQLPHARRHLDAEQYDNWSHGLDIVPGTGLAAIYPGEISATVNSIHHQSVDRVGAGLDVEARCAEDGLVEAIRSRDDDFIVGVQWHPEFHWHRHDRLPPEPLLDALLKAARRRVRP